MRFSVGSRRSDSEWVQDGAVRFGFGSSFVGNRLDSGRVSEFGCASRMQRVGCDESIAASRLRRVGTEESVAQVAQSSDQHLEIAALSRLLRPVRRFSQFTVI